jgi:integrase/recombinase XerD
MNAHIEQHLDRVEEGKAESTYEKRRVDLKNFNEWIEKKGHDDVTELGSWEVEGYLLDQKNAGYASETIRGRFQSVRGLYNTLVQREVIDENPLDDLNRSEYLNSSNTQKQDNFDRVYLTPEEKEQLVKSENIPNPALRNELLIRLMWQTGIRASEAINIQLDDINREKRCISIDSAKTDENRTVFYQPSLDLLMDQWIVGGYRDANLPADESDYLFLSRETPQIGRKKPNEIVKKAAENAGIQEEGSQDMNGNTRYKFTGHSLRHGHAVNALKSGIDVRTVQKHLGHADIEQTMTSGLD